MPRAIWPAGWQVRLPFWELCISYYKSFCCCGVVRVYVEDIFGEYINHVHTARPLYGCVGGCFGYIPATSSYLDHVKELGADMQTMGRSRT